MTSDQSAEWTAPQSASKRLLALLHLGLALLTIASLVVGVLSSMGLIRIQMEASYRSVILAWGARGLVDEATIHHERACVATTQECHWVLAVQAVTSLGRGSGGDRVELLAGRLASEAQRLIENEDLVVVSIALAKEGSLVTTCHEFTYAVPGREGLKDNAGAAWAGDPSRRCS